MANQTGRNKVVAYKVESVFNTAVTGSGGYQFRFNAGGGLNLQRPPIIPGEVRSDGQTAMGRLGSKSVTGSYSADMSVGTFDPLFEAMFRSTWVAATAITVDNSAANVSFQVTSTSAVAYVGSTSLLAKGLRAGDVCRFTNMSTAANNSINFVVASVASDGLSFTTLGTPLTVQGADTAATLTILKKLSQTSTLTRRSFTFDEYSGDLDLSKVASGCRVASCKLTGQPNAMALVEFGVVGADMVPLASGSSPSLTSPDLTTSIGLTWLDSLIRIGGVSFTNLTSFDITFDNGASALPVIGSTAPIDVFENPVTASGSLSMTLQDYAQLTAFTNETEFEFHGLLTEPESEPKDCFSVFIPRCKYTGFNQSIGADGADIVTLPFMVGAKGVATGYDASMVTFCTSAA